MSEVFVSYKREDEGRVAPLVRALEAAGHSVWWDRSLAGGESWRQEIEQALERARCVVVVWTRESVGRDGGFVRDEAARAMRRGLLVPVLCDKVAPPLGFGEIQAIDLTRWKGSSRDPFFQDLCAAVTAKLEGRAAPPAKGPMKRRVRRLAYGSLASTLGASVLLFGLNAAGVQDRFCGVAALQPFLSDACGAVGLGHRPTQAERVAWESRAAGDCGALRTHLERFPGGAYGRLASDMLTARRTSQSERWTPTTRRLALFVGQGDAAFPVRTAAETAALHRAQPQAERLCQGFAATTSFKLVRAVPGAQSWSCSDVRRGVTCGFDGVAVCELLERSVEERESCGPVDGQGVASD
jgi:hypothetical protein